jgi:hypothetical protein
MTTGRRAVQFAEVTRSAAVWCLPPDPAAIVRVRRIVRDVCVSRGYSPDVVESVVLAIDELSTNSMRVGAFEVRFYPEPRFAWGVADMCVNTVGAVTAGLTPTAPGDPDVALTDAGRGLQIVGALFPDHEVRATTLASGLPGKEVLITVR